MYVPFWLHLCGGKYFIFIPVHWDAYGLMRKHMHSVKTLGFFSSSWHYSLTAFLSTHLVKPASYLRIALKLNSIPFTFSFQSNPLVCMRIWEVVKRIRTQWVFSLEMAWATDKRHSGFNTLSLQFIRIIADVAVLYLNNSA